VVANGKNKPPLKGAAMRRKKIPGKTEKEPPTCSKKTIWLFFDKGGGSGNFFSATNLIRGPKLKKGYNNSYLHFLQTASSKHILTLGFMVMYFTGKNSNPMKAKARTAPLKAATHHGSTKPKPQKNTDPDFNAKLAGVVIVIGVLFFMISVLVNHQNRLYELSTRADLVLIQVQGRDAELDRIKGTLSWSQPSFHAKNTDVLSKVRVLLTNTWNELKETNKNAAQLRADLVRVNSTSAAFEQMRQEVAYLSHAFSEVQFMFYGHTYQNVIEPFF
jgi:hypothetical protein